MNIKDKIELEDTARRLEEAINSGRIRREFLESWIYNSAKRIKQRNKGREITFNLYDLKAALKKSNKKTLSELYVKMRLLELSHEEKSKKKWKKRKIPGLNS